MFARAGENGLEMELPCSAQLSDGRWVSNYHLLPEDVLRLEGWKKLIEVKPEYDPATQRLEVTDTKIGTKNITLTYAAMNLMTDTVTC